VFSVGWGGGMGSMLGSFTAQPRYFSKADAIERSSQEDRRSRFMADNLD
jgi:hypothetical protein